MAPNNKPPIPSSPSPSFTHGDATKKANSPNAKTPKTHLFPSHPKEWKVFANKSYLRAATLRSSTLKGKSLSVDHSFSAGSVSTRKQPKLTITESLNSWQIKISAPKKLSNSHVVTSTPSPCHKTVSFTPGEVRFGTRLATKIKES